MEKPDLSLYPDTPGVYLYKDASGKIIYVGKARRLRRRLASYFRPEAALPSKTRAMLHLARSLDILNTATEKEALLLESSLIKKHRPRYNIVLRDDKAYLLFRISHRHPYPRVEVIRHTSRKRERGDTVYGPFSSGTAARETWKLIHRFFPLRRCRDTAFKNRTRPCLYHSIGQCLGPCTLPVPREEYNAMLHKVGLFLSGRSRELLERLHADMSAAAEAMHYEEAALFRDQIKAIENTVERQSVVLAPGTELDLIGVAQTPEGLALGVVFVRDGLLIDGSSFFWPALSMEDTPELLYSFLCQFYLTGAAPTPPRIVLPWLPKAVTGQTGQTGQLQPLDLESSGQSIATQHTKAKAEKPVEDAPSAPESAFPPAATPTIDAGDLLADWEERFTDLQLALAEAKGSAVTLAMPRNTHEDRLAALAATNAREAVKTKKSPELAGALAGRLHSPRPVRRIEMVDISHTSGQQTRAGMVVFIDEEPCKSDYRVYSLDDNLTEAGAEAGDDYAALAAWATRRARAGAPWADLVLVDGGKGQLAAVERAFKEAGVLEEFVLASIAKARTEEGKQDRRAGNTSDRIFLAGRSNPVNMPPGCPELLYLQRVRDAAHDFVIGRHRQARAAATLAGELTRLPGVGPHLAKELFQHFGSLPAMAKATEQELRNVPGVGKAKAALLHERLGLLLHKE
ncbi:excinuclease ABC subunit UvrC [Desulfovibrio cuneatus]|uniref:excinuclease ABC subunit UvrC n=1 Tax=Desulfovibrio cuneatus TaxID=159728 RepID=UPI000405AED2|nr:excinuclease ABC subunit UvrC [Desulfovibrio cuneatus]